MRKLLPILIVLLVLIVIRPLGASTQLPLLADVSTDMTARYTNFDGRQLLLSATLWPTYQTGTTAYLRFDTAGDDPISTASLSVAITQNWLPEGGSVTLALYDLTDNTWDEAMLAADADLELPETALATAVADDATTQVTFSSSALLAFLNQQRLAGEAASFALRIVSFSSGIGTHSGESLFAALVLGDQENGNLPEMTITEETTAVDLSRLVAGSSVLPSPILLLLLLLVGATAVVALRPTFSFAQLTAWGRDRCSRFFILLLAAGLPLFAFVALLNVSPAAADAPDSCVPARPVLLSARAEGDDVILSWEAQPSNSAYLIYAVANSADIEPAPANQLAALAGDAAEFTHLNALSTADNWVYVVVATAACDGSAAATPPFGLRVASTVSGWNLVANAYDGPRRASDLLAANPDLEAVLKFDAESQSFAAFIPPFTGHDFDLLVGDPLFVTFGDGVMLNSSLNFVSAGYLQPTDFGFTPEAFNPFSIPLQRGDLDNGQDFLADFSCADAVYLWDAPMQQFSPVVNATSLSPFTPLFAAPTLNPCARWPRDNGFIAYTYWPDTEQLYLRWATPEVGSEFQIFWREVGGFDWDRLDGVEPVADFAAFSAAVPGETIDALSLDLRAPGVITPLTGLEIYDQLAGDLALQYIVGNRHPEIALAFGSAYSATVPVAPGQTYQFYVAPVGYADPPSGTPYLRPVCVSDAAPTLAALQPKEVNLAAVPTGLGVIPTTRIPTGAERYDYDLAQSYRQMDGRVFLDWRQMTPQPSGASLWDCWDDAQLSVAGFTVERNLPAATGYTAINPISPGGVTQLVGQSTMAAFPLSDRPAVPFRFEDAVAEKYPFAPPADIYALYDYRVCAVNHLGHTIRCDEAADIPVRELDTPRAPELITPTLDALHTELTLTWVFSDAEEVSLPVVFYVMRSLTLTAALQDWEQVAIVHSTLLTTSLPIAKQPGDEGQMYWYAVQTRDAAGNWSPISAPQNAAFYPRVAPPFAPAFGAGCTDNSMPLTLTGINPAYKQLALYRAFDPAGPYKLTRRFWIENGEATLTDDYIPTYTTDVYYRLEALDAHGNVSEPQDFCARKTTTTPPARPLVGQPGALGLEDESITFPVNDSYIPGDIWVEMEEPGPPHPGWVGGMAVSVMTATVTGDQAQAATVDWGAALEITVRRLDPLTGQPSDAVTRQTRRVNNFLNTGRHLTDLGPMTVEWEGEIPRITLTSNCAHSDCNLENFTRPLVAIFRKAQQGNWLQVSPVMAINSPFGLPWYVEDESYPTLEESYSYVVLAFSPDSLELLGTWRPITLDPHPMHTSQVATVGSSFFDPGWIAPDDLDADPACGYVGLLPGALGWPATLQLGGGWSYEVDAYFVYDSGSCPPLNNQVSADEWENVYASGILYAPNNNPALTVSPLRFNDFRLNTTTGAAFGVLYADFAASLPVNTDIVASLEGIAFQYVDWYGENMVFGRYTLDLPGHIRLLDMADWQPRNAAVAYLLDPDPGDYLFPQQQLSAMIVDENLPWQINGELIEISPAAISLQQFASASPRWSSPWPLPTADSNLGYLLNDFAGGDIVINGLGLSGQFTSTWPSPISYRTSLPAAIEITADYAQVTVSNSQITGGALVGNVSATLDVYRDRHVADYLLAGVPNSGNPNDVPFDPPLLRTGARQDANDDKITTPIVVTPAADDRLAIGLYGQLLDSVVANLLALEWTQYSAEMVQPTLYLSGVSFPDPAPAPPGLLPSGFPAAAPAYYGWLPIPNSPTTALHPGLNLYNEAAQFSFGCFDSPLFQGGLNLYVRRGGVSNAISGDVAGVARHYGDFEVEFGLLELAFLDNYLLIPPSEIAFTLNLPYPSRISLPLTVQSLSADCKADLQAPPNTWVTHAYWNFEQRIVGAEIDPTVTPNRLTLHGREADLIALTDSQNGQPAQPDLTTVWYANGDNGGAQLRERGNRFAVSGLTYDLTTIKLTPFYSVPGDTDSLPFAPTLGLTDTLRALPPQILDGAGQVTPQSLRDCANFPAVGVVGCGLILFDGNGLVDYFGELTPNPSLLPTAGQDTQGQSPVATATMTRTETLAALLQMPLLNWQWAGGGFLLDYQMPALLLSGKEGGALAGVARDFTLMPNSPMPEIARGDLAIVVTFKQDALSQPYEDKLGIFTGYAAAQAAIRALAQAQPELKEQPSGQPYPNWYNWANVEPYAVKWARMLGYEADDPADPPSNCATSARRDLDDPVDLACILWSDWKEYDFAKTYDVAYKEVKKLKMETEDENNKPLFGSYHWRLTDTLKETGVVFGANLGDVIFVKKNGQWQMKSLGFGTAIEVRDPDGKKSDVILGAEWARFAVNQDGDVLLRADKIKAQVLGGPSDNYVSFALLFNLFVDGNRRVEGGLLISELELGKVKLKKVGAVLGAGEYQSQPIIYIGVRGEGKLDSFTVGGSILVGQFPAGSSGTLEVLETAGFDKVVKRMKNLKMKEKPPTFFGVYGNMYGSFPIYKSGPVEVGGYIEIEGYYFSYLVQKNGQEEEISTGGGSLIGAIYANLVVVSGRGQLELNVEYINKGAVASAASLPKEFKPAYNNPEREISTRKCDNEDGCVAFTGQIWAAVGLGACSPETWTSWDSKWWGDDGCWTFGALGALSYLDYPEPGKPEWALDYILAAE